jgi:pyrroline-5-carboxylate reductase
MNNATEPVIAFIGCGNMGRALIGGLIAAGRSTASLRGADPDGAQRERARAEYGIRVDESAAAAIDGADVVVLAVKPQSMKSTVAAASAELRRARPLIISIAAGIRIEDLVRWIGAPLPVVRTMPNTPALIRAGAGALFAGPDVDDAQRRTAEDILGAVGSTVWVESEPLLDVVTALSGSGPAYFFLLMESLEEAAVKLGLPPGQARQLTVDTAAGASRMAREGAFEPALLRRQVTSPGGTTERALEVLSRGGFANLLFEALRAAAERAAELSRQAEK